MVHLTKQGKADSRGESGAGVSISECEQGSDEIYLGCLVDGGVEET